MLLQLHLSKAGIFNTSTEYHIYLNKMLLQYFQF